MFAQRLKTFALKLKEYKLDGFIITNPVNIFYLCDFRGVSPTEREAILIFAAGPTLVTARLYQNEAQLLASGDLKVKIIDERNQIFEYIKKIFRVGLPTEALAKVGFEEQNLTVAELSELKKTLPKAKFVPTKNLVEDLRVIKSDDEISRIEKAQIISQKAFGQLLKTLKTGQTETEIADRLAKIIKDLGGQGLAFESIVATGPNSAKPHHVTGHRRLTMNDTLLIDFGAKYQNYSADIARTIFIGKPKTEQENIYRLVKKAQKETIKSITHGIKASDAYYKAHTVFKNQKVHNYFLHGLGHGIGLEVHERPYLRSTINDQLLEGMIFSVEPGLYFPSWGGVRIEDLVTIKNGKAKVLGKLSEEIIVI
ncbi:hypothetical protein A2693_00415 [Candidatus Curtissbacteria bacterium RIFCSPHIGHO2_01_FULL_40_12]|uniref:Peptidase M24 domain-containing protein n=2 Tax=Candidatus Curtissiibacteriota TaxID=1752717 RepID=A0A1F5G984_9BACT|nr:MAG: hypothetical protein A2693_00415 [Candidatus Curtissbacteria bacterium RIFCSPHIGHO2_01_FULL_40_12]